MDGRGDRERGGDVLLRLVELRDVPVRDGQVGDDPVERDLTAVAWVLGVRAACRLGQVPERLVRE